VGYLLYVRLVNRFKTEMGVHFHAIYELKELQSILIATHSIPIHLSYSLDEVPPKFNFFFCVAMSQFDWPIILKK
jgi:hypothetical protein